MKSNNRLIYILLVIITIWCIFLTVTLNNHEDTNEKVVIYNIEVDGISTDLTKIVEENKSSIVSISANDTVSTGFIYSQNGDDVYVLTSYHGIADSDSIYVYFANNYSINATLVGKNIYADLAVLNVKSPYEVKPLSFEDANLCKSGEFIISIGTPKSLDYDYSVELGMVSNSIRTIENSITVDEQDIKYYLDVIQLSSNLKPGYSGSPALNMNGEVIGMTNMSVEEGFNFALTSNEIKIIADKLINNEDCSKYQLGIKGSYLNNMAMFEKTNLNLPVDIIDGIYVEKLSENSIAGIAGVKTGDVITQINGVEIHDINDYLNVGYTHSDSFEFVVNRNGEELNLKVDINA